MKRKKNHLHKLSDTLAKYSKFLSNRSALVIIMLIIPICSFWHLINTTLYIHSMRLFVRKEEFKKVKESG